MPLEAQLVHGLSLSHFTLRLRQSSQLSWGVMLFRRGRDLAGDLRDSICAIIAEVYRIDLDAIVRELMAGKWHGSPPRETESECVRTTASEVQILRAY